MEQTEQHIIADSSYKHFNHVQFLSPLNYSVCTGLPTQVGKMAALSARFFNHVYQKERNCESKVC